MEMLYNAIEYVLQARIGTLGVDQLDIVGDVIDSKVLERGNVDLRGIHIVKSTQAVENIGVLVPRVCLSRYFPLGQCLVKQ